MRGCGGLGRTRIHRTKGDDPIRKATIGGESGLCRLNNGSCLRRNQRKNTGLFNIVVIHPADKSVSRNFLTPVEGAQMRVDVDVMMLRRAGRWLLCSRQSQSSGAHSCDQKLPSVTSCFPRGSHCQHSIPSMPCGQSGFHLFRSSTLEMCPHCTHGLPLFCCQALLHHTNTASRTYPHHLKRRRTSALRAVACSAENTPPALEIVPTCPGTEMLAAGFRKFG